MRQVVYGNRGYREEMFGYLQREDGREHFCEIERVLLECFVLIGQQESHVVDFML